MNRSSSVTTILVVVGCLLAGASPSSAQGPYYAVPAWSQKLSASTRFVLVLFEVFCTPVCEQVATAVLDRETGLVWERIPSSAASDFSDARSICAKKVRANRAGWRVPSVDELASLRNQALTSGVALPEGHPFINIVTTLPYWTSTASDPGEVYSIEFNAGILSFLGSSSSTQSLHPVWCVRGGEK